MNNLTITDHSVTLQNGKIVFKDYEAIKQTALEMADRISHIEVTEESVKEVKKELAAVNREVEYLEAVRKRIKDEVMAPYNTFAEQVKEIVGIVKDADGTIRNQVRELDEKEREEKEKLIAELWKKRNKAYGFQWLSCIDFVQPSHLNKTTSMKKVEDEMVSWFEKIDNDLEVIRTMDHADRILAEYKNTLDMATAIRTVNARENAETTVRAAAELSREWNITLNNEDDFKRVINFMNATEIKYFVK